MFKKSPALFDETLSANWLEFRQKYPQSALLWFEDDPLPVSGPIQETQFG